MDEVAPIVRGEFVYRDVLFVDVGEGKRHTRAAESEIKNFLTGKATKDQKDQVGHWYEAQLIHYGLPRSKVKDTAKVRLQQALNTGKLKVPPHITDMEAQMKKEYAAAVRKAKKGAASAGPASAPSKKRKADEEVAQSSKKTKITMNVGDLSINIEHAASTAKAASKTRAQPSEKTKKTSATSQSTGTPSKSKAVPAAMPTTKTPQKASPAPKRAAPVPKVPAKSVATGSADTATGVTPEPKAKQEPKIKAESKIKPEPSVKAEPTIKRAVKKEAKVKPEPGTDDGDGFAEEQPDTRNITAVYKISCSQLAEQLPDQADKFRLQLCLDGDRLWGGFELGMKSGVILMNEVRVDERTTFGWRAKDSWENGRLSFGRGCSGWIELRKNYGRETVHGMFHNLSNESMEFEGERRPGPLWCGKSAYAFQQEWDGYVSEAYGR